MRGIVPLIPLGLVGDQTPKNDFGMRLDLRLLSKLEKRGVFYLTPGRKDAIMTSIEILSRSPFWAGCPGLCFLFGPRLSLLVCPLGMRGRQSYQ